MKLFDLKKTIDDILSRSEQNEQLDVVIPNNENGIQGAIGATNLKYVSVGFDWNKGRLIFWPEKEMQEIQGKAKQDISEQIDRATRLLEKKSAELSEISSKLDQLAKQYSEIMHNVAQL